MIASFELDVADVLKGPGEFVSPTEGHVSSLDDLSASSSLIHANDTIGDAMASEAGLMPLPAPSEKQEADQAVTASLMAVEDGKPDFDDAATATLPMPDERSMGSISAPVETEATDGDAASLVDAPDLTSEMTAAYEPSEQKALTPEGTIDTVAAASNIESSNVETALSEVEKVTDTECQASTSTEIETEATAAASTVVEVANVTDAAQADEADAEPAMKVAREPATEDEVGIEEVAAAGATGTDSEIASTAPASTEAEVKMPEVAAPSLSHNEGTPNTMVQAPEESVVPPAEPPPTPEESPAPAIKDSTPQSASTVILPAMQVPEENPAYAMAVQFAERGIAVFPLFGFNGSDCACGQPADAPKHRPGKHPRQLASFKGASTNLATIKSWFTYFGPVNYGIAAGQQVGTKGKVLVIVDIDWYKPEGQQSVDDLIQAGFKFPDTAEVLTGGGGRHLYYLADADAKFERKLGAGIEFQTLGFYVVGPGSMHKSGKRHDWEASSDFFNGQEIADLPQWVYEKFGKPHVTEGFAAPMGASLTPCVDDLTDAEIAAYKEDLDMISPLEYGTWVEVLMALKSRSESEQMFAVADLWSQKAGYKGVEAVRATWKSIKAQGGITIKTLKRLADAVRNKDVDISRLLIDPVRSPEGDGIEWREPEPIVPSDPAREYPLDALPMIMQEAVKEVQDYAMAPMALVACSALSNLSLAAQGLYDVQRDVGLTGPISLYMLAIAESGERKSTLDTFFIKPAREFEVTCAVAAAPKLLKFNTDSLAWEAKKKGILDQITKLASNDKDTAVAEKSLASHTAAQPVAPVIPRVIYSDATPEALTRGLASEWPSGGVISSEGGAVFGGHGMNKESQMRNLAVLNELWDGKPIRIDRRTSASYTVSGARLTVAVQVQPATLGAFMDGSGPLARGSGFIARFLTCFPESTQGTRAYKKSPPNWPKLDPFRNRVADLFAATPVIEDGALKPTMLYLADEAMSVWIDFYNEIEVQLGNGGALQNVRDVASKTADNAARIAALFHVLSGEAGSISEIHMRSGARVAKWHLNESQRVFAGGIASAGHSDAQKLEEWLVAYCEDHGVAEVSVQTMSQRGPAALRKKSAYSPALDELERLGRVKVSGAPARTVYLNPTLLN